MDIKTVTFRRAALRPSERPPEWCAQVAVAGRSNVGKSSLLNWLFHQSVAKVAKTPGKTRTLNFFHVNQAFYMVDLPGYGYAKVQSGLRQEWGRELGKYLATEERLAGVISLVDIRRGLTALDLDLQELLQASDRRCVVVLTKADKVGRGQRAKVRREVQEQLQMSAPPIAVSVRSGEGRRELIAEIEDLVTEWKDRQGSDSWDARRKTTKTKNQW